MRHYGITRVQLSADGVSVAQVLLHEFDAPQNPERGDVVLEAGQRSDAAAVATLINEGNEVFVIDEVAPRINEEGDRVRVSSTGVLESFNRMGHQSKALHTLPALGASA